RAPVGRTIERGRAEWCSLRRSIEQSRQSLGALSLLRSGNLAADRRQDRWLRLRHWHRWYAGWRIAISARKEKGRSDRLRRPVRRRHVRAVCPRRGHGLTGEFDH